jgi:hypothetical protein
MAADPGSLGNLIRHIAIDRGDTGPDNLYGYGEFRLPAPPKPIDASPSRFVALPEPTRILDTRPASAVGPAALIGAVEPGEIVDLAVLGTSGVATTGVTAIAVNLTAVDIDRPGWVQALPTWRAAVGGYSNVNLDAAGQVRANFAIVPIGDNGSVSLTSTGGGHLVVDLLGYFEAAAGPVAAGRFVELPVAERVLDTRTGSPSTPLQTLQPRPVRLPTGVDPAAIASLVVTVTATGATQPGWVQIHPSDQPGVIGRTSTVNIVPGSSAANLAIVGAAADGAAVTGWFGGGTGHVVVDVVGYITSGSAPAATSGLFVPLRPARALDTRLAGGELSGAQQVAVDASEAPGIDVPTDASAVIWNLTAVTMRRAGWARVWAADATEPVTSAVNWSTVGEIRAASSISAVDAGRARIKLSDGVDAHPTAIGHLVVDVFGYFT